MCSLVVLALNAKFYICTIDLVHVKSEGARYGLFCMTAEVFYKASLLLTVAKVCTTKEIAMWSTDAGFWRVCDFSLFM